MKTIALAILYININKVIAIKLYQIISMKINKKAPAVKRELFIHRIIDHKFILMGWTQVKTCMPDYLSITILCVFCSPVSG